MPRETKGTPLLGTLWFNIAHYGLRPWPWILVGLSSLVLYPDLAAIRAALPGVDPSLVGHDLAYPLMLRLLPAGILGLMVASLLGAYMSTVDTHLNWGASYVVHDVYRRFFKTDADEHHYVRMARWVTVALMCVAALLTMVLDTAKATFELILQIGAGTGLLFIVRWLWWRVNAWSEIVAMAASFSVAVALALGRRMGLDVGPHLSLLIGVAVTTTCWVAATLLTCPTREDTLVAFCRRVRPPHRGWASVYEKIPIRPKSVGAALIAWPVASVMIYAVIVGSGAWLVGNVAGAVAGIVVVAICVPLLLHFGGRAVADAEGG